jgi:hypothetical protein
MKTFGGFYGICNTPESRNNLYNRYLCMKIDTH